MARPDEGGSTGPSWIKDDQTVEVDINRLEDFGTRVMRELDLNFRPSFEHGIMPNLKALSKKAPFGRGGLPEGVIFNEFHAKNLEAVMRLAGDVQLSLMAISLAAQSIAAEYSAGDALSKASLDDVSNAFSPTEGKTETLAGLLEKGKKGEPLVVEGKEIPLPKTVDTGGDVEPANLDVSNNDGAYDGEVRGESVIGQDGTNPYHVPGDSEGVEVRNPSAQIPKQ